MSLIKYLNASWYSTKDRPYAGYCGVIPIPGCWYWYSIGGSQKASIPNTRPIPKFYWQRSNQKQRNSKKVKSVHYHDALQKGCQSERHK